MFNENIFELTKENTNFRREILTHKFSQLVLMSVEPGDDIGEEAHDVDQVLVFVEGEAEAIVGGQKSTVGEGSLVVVPAGVVHNFINTGSVPLKLFTLYTPPEEPTGTIHRTKADALADHHH